jgi:ribosomal protein S18 acetylase RimI-like enzyme
LDTYHSVNLPTVFKKPHTIFRNEEQFSTILTNDSNILLCAEDDTGNILGIIHLVVSIIAESPIRISSKNMKIDNLIVSSKMRRFGIGKMLVTAAVEEAKKQNVNSLVLDVFSFNQSAIEFYKNFGFTYHIERFSMPILKF